MNLLADRSIRYPLLVALLLSTGCSPNSAEQQFQEYQQRVANVLEVDPQITPPVQAPKLPSRRHRTQPLVETRGGLLDTLELRHCGLLPLIAERNSSLGKVKQPSQLLSYELRFYQLLQQCYLQDRQQPLLNEEFSQRLSELHQAKQTNLTAVFWNAVFTSPAIERNLSLSRPALSPDTHPGYGDSLRALQRLKKIGQLLNPPDTPFQLPDQLERLEDHYEALFHSEYGSQLFSSLRLLTRILNGTAATIDQRLQLRPLCLSGRPTLQARYLKNVFDRYYRDQLQAYISKVYRQGRPWLELLNQLASSQPSSAAFEAFRRRMLDPDAEQGLWLQYQRALERHTRSWQRVLTQCGMMPGAD